MKKIKVQNGIIDEDGTPKKCEKCGCEDYSLNVVEKIDYIVMEQEAICKNCGYLMGYWATGYWEEHD